MDSWAEALADLQAQGIDLQALYTAKDAVTIESGKQGHGKLLYAMPFGIVLPSKKLIRVNPDGSRSNYLEFRCGTANGLTVQDVLPPSIHPETQQPYRWGGTGHWSRLPMMPPELLGYWNRLIEKDNDRRIPTGTEIDASWDDIRSALATIPPDIDRDNWIAVGMALHWAGSQTGQLDAAFDMWDSWSAGTETNPAMKYRGPEDLMTSWPGFRPENGRTLGTLFHLAREHGWTRPVPSAEEIFAGIGDTNAVKTPVDVLAGFRPPPPSPNLTLWPKLLATRADEVAHGVGCDPLVSLFAGLGAVCGAVDARTRLELVPGYQVPPVLWLLTIGEPADKKSPGSYPMFEYLYEIERAGKEVWKAEFVAWEAKEAAYKDAHALYLEHYKNPLNIAANIAGPEVPDLPPPPVPPKIIVQDITSQKLVRHCADRPRGLLCYLDEMLAWAKKTTDPRTTDDRSSWVVSYESKRYEMDRVGQGTATAENYAVSIYGNIQPQVFRKYLPSLSDDGLLQRFIPAILRPGATWKGQPTPDCFTSKAAWERLLLSLYNLPYQVYHLDDDARQEFSDFQDYVIQRQQDERIIQADRGYQTALGKITGTCGRLALVFHLIDNPMLSRVPWQTMHQAIKVTKEYVIPSLRYTYGELSGNITSMDEWLVSHVITKVSSEHLDMTDIKRAAGKLVSDLPLWQQYQVIRDSAALLEKCNWLRCVEDKPSHNHALWAINPVLKDIYRDYRERVSSIKERILGENREGVYKALEAGFPGLRGEG